MTITITQALRTAGTLLRDRTFVQRSPNSVHAWEDQCLPVSVTCTGEEHAAKVHLSRPNNDEAGTFETVAWTPRTVREFAIMAGTYLGVREHTVHLAIAGDLDQVFQGFRVPA